VITFGIVDVTLEAFGNINEHGFAFWKVFQMLQNRPSQGLTEDCWDGISNLLILLCLCSLNGPVIREALQCFNFDRSAAQEIPAVISMVLKTDQRLSDTLVPEIPVIYHGWNL